jgi:23S rRNA pseudouridine2605 synthase
MVIDNDNNSNKLNKYIAKSGICTRREAVDLIKKGKITVNGKVELQPFIEINPTDVVAYKGQILIPKKELVYFLVNKPKDISCDHTDTLHRHISELVSKKSSTPVKPIDCLSINDVGLVILTSDDELLTRIQSSNKRATSIFVVTLDKDYIKPTKMAREVVQPLKCIISVFPDKPHTEVSIETNLDTPKLLEYLESLGYKSIRLDRLHYFGLTKKDLPRGWNRTLTEKEIIFLKHFS